MNRTDAAILALKHRIAQLDNEIIALYDRVVELEQQQKQQTAAPRKTRIIAPIIEVM